MAPQFIYVMKGLKKVIPPSRIILDDIWLSFYPGAKIGVLGPNGAGKSSLLKIMAGVDQDFQGEAWAHKGTRIGYLPQEPQLDESLDVRGNVELAVAAQRKLLTRFEEISHKFAEPMSDEEMTKLIDEQGRVQEQIDAHDLWNLDNKIEVAMDALRLPPWYLPLLLPPLLGRRNASGLYPRPARKLPTRHSAGSPRFLVNPPPKRWLPPGFPRSVTQSPARSLRDPGV